VPDKSRFANAVVRASEAWLKAEKLLVGGFMALLLALILLNVVTRYAGAPLYWVDEAAVYAMVWLAFLGASALTRLRLDFAVTLLSDSLSPAGRRRLQVVATALVLAFGVALAVVCWNWMDPLGIAAAGFDAKTYAAESFNFLYTERTQTLNWPVWVVSLVMPLFALSLTLHSLANLVEDLGWSPRPERTEFAHAEAVN
jgi:TRAP-type C4-dicarboxylate transport system permease small subunit